MPKSVPLITDWSEAERMELSKRLQPGMTLTRSPELDQSMGNGSDQECWYMANDGRGNNFMFKLTVKHCLEYGRKCLTKFLIHDWRSGPSVEEICKLFPEAKRAVFTWTERAGTKKKPVLTKVEEECAYVELNTLEEILDFTLRHKSIMLRPPTEDFPHWYIHTDRLYGDFRQR